MLNGSSMYQGDDPNEDDNAGGEKLVKVPEGSAIPQPPQNQIFHLLLVLGCQIQHNTSNY